MKTKRIITATILCFILQLAGCSKKDDLALIKPKVKDNFSAARIDTYPLDWEGIHTDVMPTPSPLLIFAPLRFAAPGYDQGNTSGVSPAYNQPLGVFYITAKPRIIINRTSLPLDPSIQCPRSAWGAYTFSIDKSSFDYIFNPAVTQIADITNIEEMLVLKRPIDTSVLRTNGTEETIGTTTVWTGLTVAEGCLTGGFFRPSDFWVRISFDVVPKDGSPKVRIVKTFIPAT